MNSRSTQNGDRKVRKNSSTQHQGRITFYSLFIDLNFKKTCGGHVKGCVGETTYRRKKNYSVKKRVERFKSTFRKHKSSVRICCQRQVLRLKPPQQQDCGEECPYSQSKGYVNLDISVETNEMSCMEGNISME